MKQLALLFVSMYLPFVYAWPPISRGFEMHLDLELLDMEPDEGALGFTIGQKYGIVAMAHHLIRSGLLLEPQIGRAHV